MRHNLNRDDHSYRITTATTVGGRRRPRTNTFAYDDCTVYDREGNVIRTIPRTNSKTRTARKSTRTPVTTRTVEPTRYDASHDRDLLARMGSIHQ